MDFYKLISSLKKYYRSAQTQSGFSLVELMVSVGIVLLIAAIILIRYSSFNSAVVLRNLAFEIAIAIREAQVLSISVLGESGDFSGVYGIYIDRSDTGAVTKEYILYRDTSSGGDGIFNAGSEEFQTFEMNDDFRIVDVCQTTGGVETCNVNPIAISFERPDFDARFDIGNNGINTSVTAVEIHIEAVADNTITRIVEIGATGQISVK